jgi:hypothetical protein
MQDVSLIDVSPLGTWIFILEIIMSADATKYLLPWAIFFYKSRTTKRVINNNEAIQWTVSLTITVTTNNNNNAKKSRRVVTTSYTKEEDIEVRRRRNHQIALELCLHLLATTTSGTDLQDPSKRQQQQAEQMNNKKQREQPSKDPIICCLRSVLKDSKSGIMKFYSKQDFLSSQIRLDFSVLDLIPKTDSQDSWGTGSTVLKDRPISEVPAHHHHPTLSSSAL